MSSEGTAGTAGDTIAAVASATGRGALTVIRISGPAAARIAAGIMGMLPMPRVATLAAFRDADGVVLDQGIVLHFPAPASFTGENVLELHGHGGAVVADLLMQRLLQLGCRQARPGEFSERAFLNGKLDLAQAEGIAALIDAGSAAAARAAVRSMQGEFSTAIHSLRDEITGLRTYVEAAIDFPDEEIDATSGATLGARLDAIFATFARITAAARHGTVLREGLNVVLAGKPNAGKSSLLNRLVGAEVAIVTAVPGTTRDVLRHGVAMHGVPVQMIDTAGLRAADDVIETEGVRRAHAEVACADHVLVVLDAEALELPSLGGVGAGIPAGVPTTWVLNKIDLLPGSDPTTALCALTSLGVPPDAAIVAVSARTGAGLDALRTRLAFAAGVQSADTGAFAARRRHLDALSRAQQQVERAAVTLRETRAVELFAEDLRLAHGALGEITGEFGSDALLGEIFASFCIGK